jgi:hypothetical protein
MYTRAEPLVGSLELMNIYSEIVMVSQRARIATDGAGVVLGMEYSFVSLLEVESGIMVLR